MLFIFYFEVNMSLFHLTWFARVQLRVCIYSEHPLKSFQDMVQSLAPLFGAATRLPGCFPGQQNSFCCCCCCCCFCYLMFLPPFLSFFWFPCFSICERNINGRLISLIRLLAGYSSAHCFNFFLNARLHSQSPVQNLVQ